MTQTALRFRRCCNRFDREYHQRSLSNVFQLLDRQLVSRTIRMNWYDGSEEVTIYQALFTDTDRIP